jgi:hypothetical protein
MTGVFIVLAVGCLIALITLALEIYWHLSGKVRIRSLKENARNGIGKKR